MTSIDEQVASAAAAAGVTPLADTLGCKVSAAVELLEDVRRDGFFEEMAKLGFVPRSDEEAAEMIKTAEHAVALAQSQDESQPSVFKLANDLLAGDGGSDREQAYADQQSRQDTVSKVAAYAQQPGVAEHILALLDAEHLLGGQ